MWRFYQEALRFVTRMNSEEYLLLLLATIVLGFFCLRGFGSRSHY
ncbi:MAG: hypothetical protein NTW96_09180 [Planctomycetia bacterium]|jgi:hypothetical protein|nr:hypothetical protein [Planctomycetia bacterium]